MILWNQFIPSTGKVGMLGEAQDAQLSLPDVQTVPDSKVCPKSGHEDPDVPESSPSPPFSESRGRMRAILRLWAEIACGFDCTQCQLSSLQQF